MVEIMGEENCNGNKSCLIQFFFQTEYKNCFMTVYFSKYKWIVKFRQCIVINLQIKFILPDPDFVFQRKEGGDNEGWNSQHDGSTEGRTRRRVTLMKGGTMTALGNTARDSTAGWQQQGAAQRRVSQRIWRQQGAAWRDHKGKGRHGSKGQDSCHDGSTDGGTRRTAAALLTVDFVCWVRCTHYSNYEAAITKLGEQVAGNTKLEWWSFVYLPP